MQKSKINFRNMELQEIVIKMCNKNLVQNFKIVLRINLHFEVSKRVYGKLTIFNQNNLKLL